MRLMPYALTFALAISMANPALANAFYVALNATTNQCNIMITEPDEQTMKMVGNGAYPSYTEAEEALRGLPECDGSG